MYEMKRSEILSVANELSNAAHEVALTLHKMQCDLVSREVYSPAARVEMVLQLQALITPTIRRAEAATSRIHDAAK